MNDGLFSVNPYVCWS